MRTPAENAAGYNETNLINSNLTLNVQPLIIHGLADTNVHLQNSVQFMNILMNNGKPYQFLALPNQNHDYTGTGLTESLAASAEYFARHL
jgi:dipeptidyl-peptidase-4